MSGSRNMAHNINHGGLNAASHSHMVDTTMANTNMAIATMYSLGVVEATRICTMVAPAMGYGCCHSNGLNQLRKPSWFSHDRCHTSGSRNMAI